MNCPKCNAEVPEGAKYCPSCGAAVAATEDKPGEVKKAETSTGLEPNIAALLSYILGWITGIIFVIVEQKEQICSFSRLAVHYHLWCADHCSGNSRLDTWCWSSLQRYNWDPGLYPLGCSSYRGRDRQGLEGTLGR